MPSVYIEVYLNPGIHKDIPLKRFYRYSLPPSLAYDENGYVSMLYLGFIYIY